MEMSVIHLLYPGTTFIYLLIILFLIDIITRRIKYFRPLYTYLVLFLSGKYFTFFIAIFDEKEI
jgi:hypothetical protein